MAIVIKEIVVKTTIEKRINSEFKEQDIIRRLRTDIMQEVKKNKVQQTGRKNR